MGIPGFNGNPNADGLHAGLVCYLDEDVVQILDATTRSGVHLKKADRVVPFCPC